MILRTPRKRGVAIYGWVGAYAALDLNLANLIFEFPARGGNRAA